MTDKQYPASWQIKESYDPRENLINLKGKDYLNAQNRLLWFIKDQRAFIAAGLATTTYVVRTDLVEMDREAGFAHFKTYIRDVLGNEASDYGSETAKDFGDYAEKASTKSLARTLLRLGYGTANAQELDEGERVADAPLERKQQQRNLQQTGQPQQRTQAAFTELQAQVAPARQQNLLARTLNSNKASAKGAEQFLQELLGRFIDYGELMRGKSTLTISELQHVEQALGIGESAPDLASAPVGVRGQ